MSSFRIQSPVFPSIPEPRMSPIDPESKVMQLAKLVTKVALSTITAILAFMFLPLPFAIVTGAALITANIADCFCKCSSEHEGTRTFHIDTPRPPQSLSTDLPLQEERRTRLRSWTAAPFSETLRPEPRRAIIEQETMQSQSTQSAANEPEMPSLTFPSALDRTSVSAQDRLPATENLVIESHTPHPLLPPSPSSSSEGRNLTAPRETQRGLEPDLSFPPDAAPERPKTMVDGGNASDMPSLTFPSLSGFDNPARSLSEAAAPAPRAASISSRRLLRGPEPSVGNRGYRTLTGPIRRPARSLTSSKAAAEALVQLEQAQQGLLPGCMPETSPESDVTI